MSNFQVSRRRFFFGSLLAEAVPIASRFDGKLEYDARTQRFTNNPEVNQYLKPALRKGWELKV